MGTPSGYGYESYADCPLEFSGIGNIHVRGSASVAVALVAYDNVSGKGRFSIVKGLMVLAFCLLAGNAGEPRKAGELVSGQHC